MSMPKKRISQIEYRFSLTPSTIKGESSLSCRLGGRRHSVLVTRTPSGSQVVINLNARYFPDEEKVSVPDLFLTVPLILLRLRQTEWNQFVGYVIKSMTFELPKMTSDAVTKLIFDVLEALNVSPYLVTRLCTQYEYEVRVPGASGTQMIWIPDGEWSLLKELRRRQKQSEQ